MNYGTIIEAIFVLIVLAVAVYKTVKAGIQLAKDKDIYPKILQYITEAEATGATGPVKLQYVINKIEIYAASQGLKIDIGYIKGLIERIIAVTKTVNIKGGGGNA